MGGGIRANTTLALSLKWCFARACQFRNHRYKYVPVELSVEVNEKVNSNICPEFSVKSNLIMPTTLKVWGARAERLLYLVLYLFCCSAVRKLWISQPPRAPFVSSEQNRGAGLGLIAGWFRCCDDARVDYTSLLGLEDRRKRFSEELLDTELRDSVQLQKMYRELQRQINCWDRSKVRASNIKTTLFFSLYKILVSHFIFVLVAVSVSHKGSLSISRHLLVHSLTLQWGMENV